MTFGDPRLLALLLLAPVAAGLAAWLWRRRLAADAAWAARGLWDRLLPSLSPRRLALSVLTLTVAVTGAALALARPRWGAEEQTVERRGVDVVFLVDSSLSMGALDVPPSRLFVAKTLVRRMAREMPGNRVGLVQTEGTGVVLAPLTLDGAVIDLLLDTIDPGSLPTPGTELATGVETALRLFGEGSEKHRALVILSDGEDHGGGLEQEIPRLKEEGVVVHAFGVGTPNGAPVPIPGTSEFKRADDGGVVTSQLHEEALENLARETGGSYTRVTSAAVDPAPALRQIDSLEKRTIESQSVSTREERFQWPLALAALALLLHLGVSPFLPAPPVKSSPAASPAVRTRRPALARASILPLLLLGWAGLPSWLPWKPHLPAWAERWLYNPRERTERAIEAYGSEEPRDARDAVTPADTALRLAPEDPLVRFNAGTAHLAAGHERKAVSLLEQAAQAAPPELAPAAHYNLGNARLAAHDAAGAVEAYKQALRLAPDNADAKWNLELALRERDRQRQGAKGQSQGSRGDREGQDPSRDPGRGGEDRQQDRSRGQDPGEPQQSGQQESEGAEGESRNPSDKNQGPLSRFRNQPEMSAREAASVLAAVENLERQQRRDQAAKRARQRSAQGKDW